MSAYTIDQPSYRNAFQLYLKNVNKTARAFAAALLAIKTEGPLRKVKTSGKARAARLQSHQEVSLLRLYRLATQTDSISPNLIQELQMIAARNQG
jgi:hypothetical protein